MFNNGYLWTVKKKILTLFFRLLSSFQILYHECILLWHSKRNYLKNKLKHKLCKWLLLENRATKCLSFVKQPHSGPQSTPVLWPHSHASAQLAALNLYLTVGLLWCCRQYQLEKFRAWNLITIHMLSNLEEKIKMAPSNHTAWIRIQIILLEL